LCLGQRTINHRQRRGHFIDGVKAHARHNADDFTEDIAFFIIADVNPEAFPNRIFAPEILFGQGLIDHDNARSVRCISGV